MKTVTSEGCNTYTLYYVSFIIATLFRIMRLQKKTQHWTNFYITVVLCFHIFWFVISDHKFLFLAVSFLSFDGSSSHNTTLTNEKQELLTRNYHWNCVCMRSRVEAEWNCMLYLLLHLTINFRKCIKSLSYR